jgi:hypothetical protein
MERGKWKSKRHVIVFALIKGHGQKKINVRSKYTPKTNIL